MGDNVTVVHVGQQPEQIRIGFFAVLLLAAFVGLVIKFFWPILCVSIVLGFVVIIWRNEMQRQRDWEDRRVEVQAIHRRADRQRNWWESGDPRAFFGETDEGSSR